MVWGGPALVVVASFVTLALVIRHPDPALNTAEPDMRRAPAEDDSGAHQPAMPARNHAAEKH
jgi:hypothetical protein